MDILSFAVGLALIVKGADWLTDGAADVAHRMHIPTLVIGLTVVAVGTSAPEFVVSLMGALRHSPDIAIGNVVGSNIFNIFGIIGCTALVSPIVMTRSNVMRDLPIMVLSQVVLFIMLLDVALAGAQENSLTRGDGLILLCLFIVFLYYTVRLARRGKDPTDPTDPLCPSDISPSMGRAIRMASLPIMGEGWGEGLLIAGGLACLIVGGDWMVDGASGIARVLGVSEAIIALTIVSIGTSAPELATSIMAARKGDNAMAVGNIVGSVVFNTLLILGASATVCPLPMVGITMVDMFTLLGAAFLFWFFGWMRHNKYTVTRSEGLLMVLLQVAYYVYLIYNE
ncbi:MAG: calcium/sodium antiporter [Bacteroidaceae bacterium]|nr:calcium/sodium antiporter [Bacteroidaceae bacterium]